MCYELSCASEMHQKSKNVTSDSKENVSFLNSRGSVEDKEITILFSSEINSCFQGISVTFKFTRMFGIKTRKHHMH